MNNRKISDFTDILNYICTLSCKIEYIKNDLILFYNSAIKRTRNVSISTQNIKILQNELKVIPRYISALIGILNSEAQQNDIFNGIYEDVIIDIAKDLEIDNYCSTVNLLFLLTLLHGKTENNSRKYEIIYDKLDLLEKSKKLEICDIYLSFISQNNLKNITDFLNYHLNHSSDYYYKYLNTMILNNKHWLIDIINRFKKNEISSSEIMETLNGKLLHLIMLTISDEEISVNYFYPLEKLLQQLDNSQGNNIFIYNYCKELNRKIMIARFCYENSLRNKEYLFRNIHNKSFLSVLNKMCKLQDFEYESIINLLKINRNLQLNEFVRSNNWEEDLYTAFVIITTGAQVILAISKSKSLDDIENLFQHIKSTDLCLKILKYMFSLLFLKYGHVSWEATMGYREMNFKIPPKEYFLCSTDFIIKYLPLLKKLINITQAKIKLCQRDKKYSDYMEEFFRISELVENAFWRKDTLLCGNIKRKYCDSLGENLGCSSASKGEAGTSIIQIYSPDKCINFLLSHPTSIVNQCVMENDFSRVHNVAERYHIQDSYEMKRAIFLEKFIKLKSQLWSLSSKNAEFSTSKFLVEEFMKNVKIPNLIEEADIINISECTKMDISVYDYDESQNIILTDLFVTSCNSYNSSMDLLSLLKAFSWNEQSSHKIFLNKVCNFLEIWREHDQNYFRSQSDISLMNIVMSEYFPNKLDSFKKFLAFNENLKKLMPNLECVNEQTEESFEKTLNLLADNPYGNSFPEFNYMDFLWKYLQQLKSLLQLNPDCSTDINIFNYLTIPLGKIVGDLIYNEGIPLNEVEKIANPMNINLFEVIISGLTNNFCCIASIDEKKYSFNNNIFDTCVESYNSRYKPDITVIEYLRKHNWLMAYIIEKLYDFKVVEYPNKIIFKNLFNLERIQNLAPLYGGNIVKSAMNYLVDINLLNKHRTVNNLKNEELLNIFLSIPTIQFKQSAYLRNEKNLLFCNLSEGSSNYIKFIENIDLQYSCIKENIWKWDDKSLKFALEYIIEHVDFTNLTLEKQEFLKIKFNKLIMFEKVVSYLSDYTWHVFQDISQENAVTILKTLLINKQIELSLDWICLLGITCEQLSYINENFLSEALQVNQENMLTVSKFLHELNINQALLICEKSLPRVNNLNAFKVFSQFILHHENTIVDYNLIISINILIGLEPTDCLLFLKIIMQPLLIIEQYLMNSKFDKLKECFKIIRNKLLDDDKIDSNTITMIEVEKLLIAYAKKSLSFDVPKTSKIFINNDELLQPIDTIENIVFTMPQVAPKKSEWIPNESANECMCCKKIIFSMFNRRHHCRRCGRVVCGLCSMNRLKLSTYNDLNVRVCNQCYEQTKYPEGFSSESGTSEDISMMSSRRDYNPSMSEQNNDIEWILNGDLDHDSAIREEFSYAHAPSISLCLSILELYDDSEEAPNFLLSECEAIITIMKPKVMGIRNNEIDYSLLIEIMRALAIAAKVKFSHLIELKTKIEPEISNENKVSEINKTSYYYAGITRCDYILNYADLASLLVQNGCEGLLTSSMEAYDIQILREQLMLSEQWSVALEVSLKAGLDKTSVFAAWGKICLKAGAFRTAREKFSHCLKAVDNSLLSVNSKQPDIFTVENFMEEKYSQNVFKYTTDHNPSSQVSASKMTKDTRPSKDPTLLNEIIDILEKVTYSLDATILKNFEEIKQSQENFSQKKLGSHIKNNLPEPPLYILHTLANLRNITNGIYESQVDTDKTKQKSKRLKPPKSENASQQSYDEQDIKHLDKFIFDECKYYLNTYGSHEGIIKFYMQHSTINQVLEYILNNLVEKNVFTEAVFMESLKIGSIEVLYHHMSSIDPTLLIWKDYLSHTCRYLEKLQYMHTLYSLQLFMKDFVRASMTCIYFYSLNCTNYTNLHENILHLNNAEKFLRQELEAAVNTSTSTFHVLKEASAVASGFIKKLSYRELDQHISTICKQREVAKFLADCEVHGRDTFIKLNKMFVDESSNVDIVKLPTLFGSQLDRLQVATLVILCGRNVEEGFGLAFRIAQDYKLQGSQLYRECARYLARCGEGLMQVAQLCRCVNSSGLNQQKASVLVDELAAAALYEASILQSSKCLDGADAVVRCVSDIGVTISCYINIRQLKSAYLLAVKHDRLVDVRRIQREAEKLGQSHVVALCTKRLNM